MRAGDQDGDFAHGRRQRRIGHHRLDQLPYRLAEFRLVQPRDSTAPAMCRRRAIDEALKILGDALAHIVIERLLLGAEIAGR